MMRMAQICRSCNQHHTAENGLDEGAPSLQMITCSIWSLIDEGRLFYAGINF